ncbi:hypothetical protein CfE428DRAFT_6633 [Chthoniobacter flavus Ellin428]|uniref:Ice-binding protein C-terminal domain-containing protein n=2 Tax=Chthoniobacter flavus TaxID=191863 RepID=B4DCJ2_9BACT|nr:hypothetical protein CfE428DRAFT_6633 [Chthoniobacter flavus Ellin428]TCO87716.1 putative secreted protein with PEP-CTERM sorting signal [Chthoniobacter flavus]
MATAALALAGVALTAPVAKAAATTGDLILSFRFSDNTNVNDIEIDLGQQTNFTTTSVLNLTYGANYYAGSNLGGLASSDLDAVFGTSGGAWNTLSNLVWDVSGHIGTTGTNTHLFATQPTTGTITAAAPGSNLTSAGSRLQNLSNGFDGVASSVAVTSPEAWAVPISPATVSEYTFALKNGSNTSNDFGFFTTSTESHVSSAGNMSMELYNYGPSTRTDLGTITLTSDGQLSFTGSAASVPEPSALTALAGGIGLLGFLRRRRVSVA